MAAAALLERLLESGEVDAESLLEPKAGAKAPKRWEVRRGAWSPALFWCSKVFLLLLLPAFVGPWPKAGATAPEQWEVCRGAPSQRSSFFCSALAPAGAELARCLQSKALYSQLLSVCLPSPLLVCWSWVRYCSTSS